MKSLTRSLRVAALLCLAAASTSFAQTPGPQLPNTVVVCATEGCTVKAISIPTAVLQFGTGSTWNTITAPTLPLLADCSQACPQVGNDPAPQIMKSLVAHQQAAAYTITLGDGTVVNVPALDAPPPPASIPTPAGKAYTVTLAANVPTTSPATPWMGISDIEPSGAFVQWEGTRFNLTIDGVTLACTYVAMAGSVFTLNCVVMGGS